MKEKNSDSRFGWLASLIFVAVFKVVSYALAYFWVFPQLISLFSVNFDSPVTGRIFFALFAASTVSIWIAQAVIVVGVLLVCILMSFVENRV